MPEFSLKYIDFGFIYEKNKYDNKFDRYPRARTFGYYNENLYNYLYEKNKKYQYKDVLSNEYHTIIATLYHCLYPN